MIVLPRRVPLSDVFHASDTGEPFDACLMCERPLLDPQTEYVIEKACRRFEAYDVTETVFEYALCLSCHVEVAASLSDASRQQCETYFTDRVDLRARASSLLTRAQETAPAGTDNPVDVRPWIDACIAHGTPVRELKEYQILAHCVGNDLVLSHMPLVVGGRAMDELTQLLSQETIDALGGFREEHFGVPPELQSEPILFPA